jgi:hypothetical protein
VGSVDGSSDGRTVGGGVASEDGDGVSFLLGCSVCSIVGAKFGCIEGSSVGLAVGIGDGCGDGNGVGFSLGCDEDSIVGVEVC